MSITKITTPELLDFPNDSTSSANTSGTVIPKGYTNACNFPTFSSGVAFYQFENNNADDTCGNYNLTEVGSPSYVAGNFGEAIQFNGTSQGLTSTSAVIPNGPATISLWFNGNGTATTEFYIIGAGVGGSSYGLDIHYYDDGIVGGRFYGGVVDAGNFQGVGTGATTVNTSTWYHLALTWDGTTNTDSMKLYLNGALETNITPTVTAASLTYSSFGIGKTATSTYAPGIVDQVRIFNSVLTPTQITELYNETTTEVYRPTTSLNAGEFRFNTTAGYVEYYDGSNWQQIADEYITGQPTSCICNYPTQAVALYEFQDNTNNTCGGSAGVLKGTPTYVAGKFGKAINFNVSSNQAVDLPDNILPDNSTASSSASIWFKHAAWTPGHVDQTIIDAWNYDVSEPGWSLFISPAWSGNPDGHIYLANYYLGGSAITGSTAYDDGNWHHAVVVFDQSANKLKLYMDGALYGTETTTATNVWIFTQKAAIGWQNANPVAPRYYDGQIDQARIFSTALTETQITELYNEVPCN